MPALCVYTINKELIKNNMAQTINLDDDFIAADELKLLQTKQSILEKLRVRFAALPANKEWSMPAPATQELSDKRTVQSRYG
jgi:hypothetical protein